MYMRFMYIEESLPIDVYQTLASHHYRHMINTNKKEENLLLVGHWAIYEILKSAIIIFWKIQHKKTC